MLEQMGVKRISLGSSIVRAAYGAFFRAIEEIFYDGTFHFAADAKPYADINKIFESYYK